MMSQMLKDLQVLSDFFLALSLLLHISLTHALDGDEVTAQFVLGNYNFAKRTLTELVANTIKLVSRRHWAAHFLEVCDDHGD